MNNPPSISEIQQVLNEQQVEKVKVAVTDIDGILRGKMISVEKFHSVMEKGFGFCDVVFGWDAADSAYDNAKITGWHSGYPDAQARIDLRTFRQIPWENGIPFFLADFDDGKGNSLCACPRSLLKEIDKRARNMGFLASFSQEFEWFNLIREKEIQVQANLHLQPMTEGMFGYSILRASQKNAYFNDLFDYLKNFKVPLEGIHTETGPGVYEAAILYADLPEAADRAVLFKTAVKEIAFRHGLLATFMAKYSANLPGCSGHVHQSLWSANGKENLFYDSNAHTTMSKLMGHYIAGQLYCLPHLLPMYAPTVNSYKRLVEGAWAPTTITWGIDNRTTALRALPGSAQSTRLETRVVGSDSNPYLAMAACLASGLFGITNQLELKIQPTKGNGYADKSNGILPSSLIEASKIMRESPIAKELFGEGFVEHFTATREWEWRQFSKVVTDWELQRYREII